MNPQKVIDIAVGEVGYLEKSKTAYMRNPAVIWYKLDGAGYDNITKYSYEIDRIDWYAYGVQYQPWCSTMIDWCFLKAADWDIEKASKCKNHGVTDCLVDDAIEQYKKIGRWFHEPEKGDQVFFAKANGIDPAHTGLVIDVDDEYVHTVEGNTNSQDGTVEANGGGVFRKKYRKNYYRLLGYGRPLYEEDDNMDIKGLLEMLKKATSEERRALGGQLDECVYAYRVKMEPSWGEDELQEAKDAGITDATRPLTYCTRQEAAIMCKRAVKGK